VVSVAGSLEALVEQLPAQLAELETALAQRDALVTELERQLAADSSNSSRPPSSMRRGRRTQRRNVSSGAGPAATPANNPGASGASRSR
jgi:uncharacterized coiled-coil protein SlyX